jgi:DNA-binding MarR family transcriptional regulator
MPFSQTDIGVEILRLTLRCRDIDKHLSAKVDLSIDEMHCLCVIYSEKPSCVKKVSEFLDVNATRTSKILSNLERRGFITRTIDLSDHRKEQITLTGDGTHVVEKILSLYTQVGSKMSGDWSSDVIAEISNLLQTVELTSIT